MFKIRDSLRRLIGRVKKHMSNWFLIYGSMMMPLSVVMLIFSFDIDGWKMWGCIGVGLTFLFAGIAGLQIGWKLVKKEQKTDDAKFLLLIEKLEEISNKLNPK
jgi:hypothetical protein